MKVEELRLILDSQKYKCGLTGVSLEPESMEFDHIVPRSEGGQDTPSNLMAVTRTVNQAKGVLSLVEFVEMCHQVAGTISIRKARQLHKKGKE